MENQLYSNLQAQREYDEQLQQLGDEVDDMFDNLIQVDVFDTNLTFI